MKNHLAHPGQSLRVRDEVRNERSRTALLDLVSPDKLAAGIWTVV